MLTPRRAVDIGATAISVSNHGGNNLDGTPAALRALPAVVRAVGNDVEILYDGGVRRGGDVVKALALGARAVLIGRAWIFGLAADGERGVREVLEIFRAGIDNTLVALGHKSIHGLSPTTSSSPKVSSCPAPRARAPHERVTEDLLRARRSPELLRITVRTQRALRRRS